MVKHLKGFLGKTKKPVIVNGKLIFAEGNQMLLAYLENYRVTFSAGGTGNANKVVFNGEKILLDAVKDFNHKYARIGAGSKDIDPESFTVSVDAFTGAVVITTPIYEHLMEEKFHDGYYQYPADVTAAINEFTAELTLNYFDIYVYLLNRRLTASHMTIKVKGHFVAGLYQPILVGTDCIKCPLDLGEFQWFRRMIAGHEVSLEHLSDSTRRVELTCISMADMNDVFHTYCIKELDRKYFVFMLYLVLCQQLSLETGKELAARYNGMLATVRDNPEMIKFLDTLLRTVKGLRSGITVR